MVTKTVLDICNFLITCSSLCAIVMLSMEMRAGQEMKIGLVPENMQMGLDPTLNGADGKKAFPSFLGEMDQALIPFH